MQDLGFIRCMIELLSLMATPDKEKLYIIPNEEVVGVPKISNYFNIRLDEDIYMLTDGGNTNYKPRNLIPIPPFLLQKFANKIVSLQGYIKIYY